MTDVPLKDDASRNGAGQLSDDNRRARILKGPFHRFIFLRTIGPARIETEPLSMLTINHATTDRRAICMDVEDRQEDSDTTQFCFQNLGFFDLDDIRHSSVSGRDDRAWICGDRASWIAQEENGVGN